MSTVLPVNAISSWSERMSSHSWSERMSSHPRMLMSTVLLATIPSTVARTAMIHSMVKMALLDLSDQLSVNRYNPFTKLTKKNGYQTISSKSIQKMRQRKLTTQKIPALLWFFQLKGTLCVII